jgi:hypothetical protein
VQVDDVRYECGYVQRELAAVCQRNDILHPTSWLKHRRSREEWNHLMLSRTATAHGSVPSLLASAEAVKRKVK